MNVNILFICLFVGKIPCHLTRDASIKIHSLRPVVTKNRNKNRDLMPYTSYGTKSYRPVQFLGPWTESGEFCS